MPVIIDEIVIAIDVGNGGGQAGAGQAGGRVPALSAEERQALVAECTERVLDVLRDRDEP